MEKSAVWTNAKQLDIGVNKNRHNTFFGSNTIKTNNNWIKEIGDLCNWINV